MGGDGGVGGGGVGDNCSVCGQAPCQRKPLFPHSTGGTSAPYSEPTYPWLLQPGTPPSQTSQACQNLMPFLICGLKNHRGLLQGPLNSYHSPFFAPYTRLHSYGDVYTAAIINLKHAGSIHYQTTRWKWREKYFGLMKWKWMRDLIGPQITSVCSRWSSQLGPVISCF